MVRSLIVDAMASGNMVPELLSWLGAVRRHLGRLIEFPSGRQRSLPVCMLCALDEWNECNECLHE